MGFIPPLIIFAVKREQSRFAAFHALQAVLWHAALMVALAPVIGVFFLGTIARLVEVGQHPPKEPPADLIAGLYAAGSDQANVIGGHYPSGGINIGPAMTFGYIAGRHAARVTAYESP